MNKLEDLYSLLSVLSFICGDRFFMRNSFRKFLDLKPWSDFAFFRSYGFLVLIHSDFNQ